MTGSSSFERSYSDIVGDRIADAADDVRDMGRRVVEVLSKNPRDHHYAGEKMHYATARAVEVLVYAGWTEEQIDELVRGAKERARGYVAELQRELLQEVPDGR